MDKFLDEFLDKLFFFFLAFFMELLAELAFELCALEPELLEEGLELVRGGVSAGGLEGLEEALFGLFAEFSGFFAEPIEFVWWDLLPLAEVELRGREMVGMGEGGGVVAVRGWRGWRGRGWMVEWRDWGRGWGLSQERDGGEEEQEGEGGGGFGGPVVAWI